MKLLQNIDFKKGIKMKHITIIYFLVFNSVYGDTIKFSGAITEPTCVAERLCKSTYKTYMQKITENEIIITNEYF